MRPRRRTAGGPPSPAAGSLWTTALRLLTRREYTTVELRTRLLDRGYPAADVDAAVTRLAADGTLDDRRVARLHIRAAREIKGRGRVRIERELVHRGIAPALAHELLADLPAGDDEAQIARILARKRVPARLSLAERRRIFQHLLRRGFPADVISRALSNRGGDDES
ncbi:MAG TPA: regulatory protein RecX [Vicinamibacterales bacterium]|nr:regulatory protein RecX [Vicinamibacterales bacterium]